MSSPDLLMICTTAFAAVFSLLCVLAAVQRLIPIVFPDKKETSDAMLYASIAAVFQNLNPGMRISKVEEIK